MRKTYVCLWWMLIWSPCAWGVVQLEVGAGKRWIETSHRTNVPFTFTGQENGASLRLVPFSTWPVAVGVSYATLQLNPGDFVGAPHMAEMRELGGEMSLWMPFFERAVPFLTVQILLDAHLRIRGEETNAVDATPNTRLHGGRALVGMRYRVLPISAISLSVFQGIYEAHDI